MSSTLASVWHLLRALRRPLLLALGLVLSGYSVQLFTPGEFDLTLPGFGPIYGERLVWLVGHLLFSLGIITAIEPRDRSLWVPAVISVAIAAVALAMITASRPEFYFWIWVQQAWQLALLGWVWMLAGIVDRRFHRWTWGVLASEVFIVYPISQMTLYLLKYPAEGLAPMALTYLSNQPWAGWLQGAFLCIAIAREFDVIARHDLPEAARPNLSNQNQDGWQR